MNNKHRDTEYGMLLTQIYRFSLVGLASNACGYALYLLITYSGGTPKLTMSFLYLIGATVSFWGNRNLTFMDTGNVLGSYMRYTFAHLLGYLLNLAILITMVDWLGYSHKWVQGLAVIIVALFLFVIFRLVVFKNQPPSCIKN